ncbi:MAG: hypothetical protein JXA66_00510, partial [Oligoflexia bacterium]|nr:hypothetical protein [Oligoflexia bacterium]
MIIVLLIASMLNFAVPREWVISPKLSHGSMDSEMKTANIPTYSKSSLEYAAQQIALEYENVLPVFNPKHKDIYLSNLPKVFHKNFGERVLIFSEINSLKNERKKATEGDDGLLKPSEDASEADNKLIEAENSNRKELFSL